MSEKKYITVVTDIGLERITEAAANGRKVNITTIAVGDGNGSYYKPVPSMTELKNKKWHGAVNTVAINENTLNVIDVIGVVPSDVGGFTIREIGIFDEGGSMIAVGNTPDTEKVVITTGASGEIELTIHIEVSNAEAISFVIDPNVVLATKKDIENHNRSDIAHLELFASKADKNIVEQHINNLDVHTNLQEKNTWNKAAQDAIQANIKAAELEGRIARVEDELFGNITGNPFLISFDTLEGVEVTKGIWNSTMRRIEC